jgi:hypothetical protein
MAQQCAPGVAVPQQKLRDCTSTSFDLFHFTSYVQSAALTLSDPKSDLVRQYDFRVCSDVGRRPTLFFLRLFASCRSLSDAFSHVVWTLANR